jgi:membrane-bound ClpP family serine protease
VDSTVVAILLYLVALALALVDLYVPSAGMLILLSFVAAVGSVLFGFRGGTTAGMTMLTLVAGSIPVLAVVAIRIWPHTPVGRRIVLALPPEQPTALDAAQGDLSEFIGCVLVSEYPLMPGGRVTIARRPCNAIAEAGYIDAGQRVEVVAVRQRNLIVRITDKPLTPLRPREITAGFTEQPVAEALKDQKLLEVPADELGLNSLED